MPDHPAPSHRLARFAIQGGPFTDPDALAAHAREVEALGYDELYTADHVGRPDGGHEDSPPNVDPFAPLLVAASATSRLRVGPLVVNDGLHHPVLLARTAATVDRLTGGRLVLGLGTGYAAAEHRAIGRPILDPRERVTRFGASLEILRSLLDDGRADHRGRHEIVDVADLGVTPAQAHVPFLVGGNGRRVVGLGARYADIFQFTGLTHGPGGAPEPGGFSLSSVQERARWLTDDAGDRAPFIERSALVQFTACGSDAPASADLADRFGLTPEVIESSPFVLSGSLEQLVDKIGRLRDEIGITHYVVRDPAGFADVVAAASDHTT